MKQKIKTYFNWSSGKDSALALYYLLQNKNYNVEYLLTTVNTHYNRVSMHGLRRELLEKQLNAIGLPFGTLELPEHVSNETYDNLMHEKILQLKSKGFHTAAFGDIFLEDLRTYRENKLSQIDVQSVFPLWEKKHNLSSRRIFRIRIQNNSNLCKLLHFRQIICR